ncbi:unnamed protein product, partial [Ectocarpus sp. 6 AP-2014]
SSTHVACVALLSAPHNQPSFTWGLIPSRISPYPSHISLHSSRAVERCLSVPDGDKLAPNTPTPGGMHETAYLAVNANETCTWMSSTHEKKRTKNAFTRRMTRRSSN